MSECDINSDDYFLSLPFNVLCNEFSHCSFKIGKELGKAVVKFTMFDPVTDNLIGGFTLESPHDYPALRDCLDFGYIQVEQPYWHQGIATRWLKLVIAWAQRYTKYEWLVYSAGNEKSGGLAQRAGFQQERSYHSNMKQGYYRFKFQR